MLSKLLKYEFKATGRIFLPFFLSLLMFAGINKFFSTVAPQRDTPAEITMVIYVIIMAGMFVTVFIMMIQRFYKNLLSDEGYLMFTLPTKPWTHIVSKLLVSMLWIVASVIVAMISILIVAYNKEDFAEVIKVLAIFFDQGSTAYILTFEFIVSSLVSLASIILAVYASIAIGHQFSQYKLLASFGTFIVLNTLTQGFLMLVSTMPGRVFFSNVHIASNDFVGFQPVLMVVMVYAIILTAFIAGVYFALTNYFISKRLNLE